MTRVLRRLKKRRDFLRVAAQGRKWATPGLVLQACPSPFPGKHEPYRSRGATRQDGEAPPMDRETTARPEIGVGFTASKKVGGAVARNRAKRRLRALAAEILAAEAAPGHDYVLIARRATVTRPYDKLRGDLRQALAKTRTAQGGGNARRAAS